MMIHILSCMIISKRNMIGQKICIYGPKFIYKLFLGIVQLTDRHQLLMEDAMIVFDVVKP